jgi:hypothetical protein
VDISPYAHADYAKRVKARQSQQEDARQLITERAQAERNNRNAAGQGYGYGNFAVNHGQSGAYHAAVGSAQNANSLQGMIDQTMGTWGQEHANRVLQAREEQQRQHEANLKAMETQAESARQNRANELLAQSQRAKQEKNSMLLGLAGLGGGHSVRTDGRGGVSIFRNSLLG